jgi:hypothetical protein
MSRNRQLSIVALFFIAFVGTGGWIYHQQHRFRHFAAHEPGMVYRSAWIAPDALSQLIETYQIRTVVNLCSPNEMTPEAWDAERKAVTGSGAMLHAVPLPNNVQFDPEAWAPHLRIMADPNNYPMLVHCQQGVTRTAMFLTAYDVIYRHKTSDESLTQQPKFGHLHADVHVRAFGKNFDEYVHENPVKFQEAAKPVENLR